MTLMQSAMTTKQQPQEAVRAVAAQLHTKPALVLFFASTTYDFSELTHAFTTHYPEAQVVGVTTTGEIGPDGFSEHSLSAQSYSAAFGRTEATLIRDIAKYPIFDREALRSAARNVGIQVASSDIEHEGLAFVFPVGLKAGEEKMLSVLNSIFESDGFPIFGGTAGDDAQFIETFVSVNGVVTCEGAAVVFIKPNVAFSIYKENIFEGTGKKVQITKADAHARIVYEMDGRPAADVYAAHLNVSRAQLASKLSKHPIGRAFNHDFLIASPFDVLDNGAISFYCQVYEGSTVEILQPKPALKELQQTLYGISQRFKSLEGVLACNCILRKMQFADEGLFPAMNEQLRKLPNLCGFSSYGEQWNKTQLNQTLLLIGFGDKR